MPNETYVVACCAVALALMTAGCRDTVQPDADLIVAVAIEPPAAALRVGNVLQLRVIARTASGDTAASPHVRWSSRNSAVASVDSTGRVLALAAGTATIAAVVDNIEGTAELVVSALSCLSLTISPPSVTLHVGDTLRATARRCESSTADFRWSSSAPGKVTVSDSGVLTALSVGTAAIIARWKSDTTEFGALAATVVP